MCIRVPEALSHSQSVWASPDRVISLRSINRWNWFGCLETWISGSSGRLWVSVFSYHFGQRLATPVASASLLSTSFLCTGWILTLDPNFLSSGLDALPNFCSPLPLESGIRFPTPISASGRGPAVTELITWNHAWFWVLSPGFLPELCSVGR